MARARRVDGNQKSIVKKFRDLKCSVSVTSSFGQGFPDIVVGVKGLSLVGDFNPRDVIEALQHIEGIKIFENVNLLVEIKDDSQPPSKRKLTSDEEKWHESWKGQISVIENEDEAEGLTLKKK